MTRGPQLLPRPALSPVGGVPTGYPPWCRSLSRTRRRSCRRRSSFNPISQPKAAKAYKPMRASRVKTVNVCRFRTFRNARVDTEIGFWQSFSALRVHLTRHLPYSAPVRTVIPWISACMGRPLHALPTAHFPIQNFPKMLPSRSSVVMRPVISPKWCWALRRSMARSSPLRPASKA